MAKEERPNAPQLFNRAPVLYMFSCRGGVAVGGSGAGGLLYTTTNARLLVGWRATSTSTSGRRMWLLEFE